MPRRSSKPAFLPYKENVAWAQDVLHTVQEDFFGEQDLSLRIESAFGRAGWFELAVPRFDKKCAWARERFLLAGKSKPPCSPGLVSQRRAVQKEVVLGKNATCDLEQLLHNGNVGLALVAAITDQHTLPDMHYKAGAVRSYKSRATTALASVR